MLYKIKLTDDAVETVVTNEKYGTSCKAVFVPAGDSDYKLIELIPIEGKLHDWKELTEGVFPGMDSLCASIKLRLDPSWTPNLVDKVLLNDKASAELGKLADEVNRQSEKYHGDRIYDEEEDPPLQAELLQDGSLRLFREYSKKTAETVVKPGDWKFKQRFKN
jgi:hypothetical protein